MSPEEHPRTPDEALRALLEGNERHVAGRRELQTYSPLGERHAEGQQPFAAVIACADSRVSPALIFDLDLGNLFVSRVAGNSIDTGSLGSTEFAVAVLGVKLVMVLGHTGCGAVEAALEVASGSRSYPAEEYGSIGSLVDAVVPSIEALPADDRTLANCVVANVRAQVKELEASQPIIAPAVESGALKVAAAVYDVATGRVELL